MQSLVQSALPFGVATMAFWSLFQWRGLSASADFGARPFRAAWIGWAILVSFCLTLILCFAAWAADQLIASTGANLRRFLAAELIAPLVAANFASDVTKIVRQKRDGFHIAAFLGALLSTGAIAYALGG